MTRVLRVVTLASATGRYGGPFDTASRQASIAAELGHETTLLAGHLPGDRPANDQGHRYAKHFVQVRPLFNSKKFSDLVSLRLVCRLCRLVRNSDVLHISFSREFIPMLALVVGLLLRKKCIIQPHGMLTSRDSSLHATVDLVLRPLVRRASSVVALTDVEASSLRSWSRNRDLPLVSLGNPVPVGLPNAVRSRPATNDAVFIARLHKRKRVDVFLSAAEKAGLTHPALQFVVVGPDGGCLADVTSAASRMANLSYEGAVSSDEVTARVLRAGVFVLTSESEPWGNVLAIALASGIPVVVPSSAALALPIRDYKAGLVVQDAASDQVADAVCSLMTDMKLYAESSRGALRLASNLLSPNNQRRVLDSLYTED